MASYSQSSRKLQKRSPSSSRYPSPRHSLENVSLAGLSESFADTVTLSDHTIVPEAHLEPDKGRTSSHSSHQLLPSSTDPEPNTPVARHRSPLLWTSELLVLSFGLICLLAIVVILLRTDGNAPPQWPLNTNLNTVIALLASLAKAAFVTAIVEGLGQLKWIWFLSPRARPLSDFQTFEEATKGGWGSWKLLFRLRGFCATFGALILVSGLLTSTFTQMAVTYPVVQAEAHSDSRSGETVATVERATGFSVYDGDRLIPSPFEFAREQRAVYEGAFYPPDGEAPHVAPVCSSGDCAWPVYGSLAVCSDVVNLTAQADPNLLANLRNVTAKRLESFYGSIKANGDIYGWVNFQAQALPGYYPVILGPMFSPSGAFDDSVKNLILSDNFIAYPVRMLNSSEPLDLDAFHFLGLTFWWCAKSYSSQVKAGEHTTVEISTRSEVKTPAIKSPYDTHTLNMAWSPGFYPCYTAGTCNATFGPAGVDLLPPPDVPEQEAIYTINVWTGLTVSGLLAATMWDSVLMDPSHGVVTSNGGGVAKAFASSVLGDFMTPTPDANTQLAGSRQVASNIARTLTNLVRKQSGRYTSAAPGVDRIVRGTVYTPQARVRVHWGWICVLSVQLGCTFVFMGLTIWATGRKGVEVMKGSSLATLVALDAGVRGEMGGLGGFERLKQHATRVRVRLRQDSDGVVGLSREVEEEHGEEGWPVHGEKKVGVAVVEETEELDKRRQGMVFDDLQLGYQGGSELPPTDSALRRFHDD